MKKDNPKADPNVAALQGFDVTALAPGDFERYGIVLDPPVIAVERGRDPGWMSHSEFLADPEHPDHDLHDRTVARRLARDHAAKVARGWSEKRPPTVGELLKGLRLPRSFPCSGMLRVVRESRRWVEVQCEQCGAGYGVSRVKERTTAGDARAAAAGDHRDRTPGNW